MFWPQGWRLSQTDSLALLLLLLLLTVLQGQRRRQNTPAGVMLALLGAKLQMQKTVHMQAVHHTWGQQQVQLTCQLMRHSSSSSSTAWAPRRALLTCLASQSANITIECWWTACSSSSRRPLLLARVLLLLLLLMPRQLLMMLIQTHASKKMQVMTAIVPVCIYKVLQKQQQQQEPIWVLSRSCQESGCQQPLQHHQQQKQQQQGPHRGLAHRSQWGR
jgi:hypothetical protein